jgi:hypothetical protein
VSRDGRYGSGQRRQKFRCTGPDGTFHRFTPPLPREHTDGGICDACDSALHPHTGPVVGRRYSHRLRLVAEALVAVGRGVSYAHASNRARAAAGRNPILGGSAGQLVAEWVDSWAPVVIDAHAETDWPETLVLDSTDFWWTNVRTRTRRREFAILIAYGYPGPGSRNRRPRVWGIQASPTARADDWVRLLASLNLPAPPTTVVSDDNLAVSTAVRRMWPAHPGPSLPLPFVVQCEHHLRVKALEALANDGAAHHGSARMKRLDTAFRRDEAWREFFEATQPLRHAGLWARAWNERLAFQTSVRHLLPPHRTTSGAEAAAHRLKNLLERRSFSLRNAARTNLLLALVRLHLNNSDDAGNYHRLLRERAEASGGLGQQQRTNRDTRDAQGNAQPSLR